MNTKRMRKLRIVLFSKPCDYTRRSAGVSLSGYGLITASGRVSFAAVPSLRSLT